MRYDSNMDNQLCSEAACTHCHSIKTEPATPPPRADAVPIKGSVVLITGANRGIGKALVDAFLKHGAKKVYAAVRDITRYRAFSNEENDETIIPLYIDLSKPETIEAAAELSQDVDIVINNAGVLSKTNPLDGNAIEALKTEMDVNVYGLMAMAQAYAPILKKNSGKTTAFVQLNSVASFRCSGKDVATYSATKAAAYSITQALAQELAPHDVRVLSVHPGPVRTEMLPERLLALAEAPSTVAEDVIRALADGTPLHVFPDPHSKQLATIMRPFLTKVVEGGDVYNQGK